MLQIINSQYGKAAGISLVLHCLLLFGMGQLIGQTSPAVAEPPVLIEIVPAGLLDMGNIAAPEAAAADAPVSESTPPTPRQPAIAHEAVSQMPQRQSAEPFLTQPVTAGARMTEGVGVPAAGGTGNTMDESRQAGGADSDGESGPGEKSTSANVLNGTPPKYPAAARESGWEGSVLVRLLIDTDGTVATVTVRDSSGYKIFDETAVQAVKKWKFSPATQAGKSIASFYDVRVRFHLTDSQ